MNYEETLSYLYNSAPLFQQIGKDAYKEGLDNTYILDEHFNHPHKKYKTIHIAGTNGKGSCSHTLAAILQHAGYKVGLYTSPHLVDFRERIRINGIPISEESVIRFVEKERSFFEPLHPSFFELTTAMAFSYFAEQNIDIAVVEVGLGGRLDCTNIITPILGIITNISFDHMQFLGNTLAQIASEKAGIIKKGVPVIIGETTPETRSVFEKKANEKQAPIYFAEDESWLTEATNLENGGFLYTNKLCNNLVGELGGYCQIKNTNTLLSALHILQETGLNIHETDIREGFAHVCELTGLKGRWQKLQSQPTIVCDTGHNTGGISYIVEQLKHQKYEKLRIVFGMVNDKDINSVLDLMPKDAVYYFTQASVKRAMPAQQLQALAQKHGLNGKCFPTVKEAVEYAQKEASKNDFIYIGGSSFIVADLLTFYKE